MATASPTPLTNGTADAMSWRSILAELYGESATTAVSARVEALLTAHDAPRPRQRPGPWDETDTWLVTYPDQFVEESELPLSTLLDFIDLRLRRLFNGIHILPFFPSSSDDGFSVTNFLEVDGRLGAWRDVEAISESWRLMVDAVINHSSVQGEWFEGWRTNDAEYRHFFRTAQPSADLSAVVRAREHPLLTKYATATGNRWVWTTFSPDQADLDYRNPEVLLRILDVLLTYCSHGADVIRLDAAGFLWKEEGSSSIHLPGTHGVIRFLRACLELTYPDVVLVTETNVPHEENISYFGDRDHPEAHAVYQFPLPPLTLHAFATGDASALEEWLRTLPPPRKGTTFINFLASHDGVGLRPLEGLVNRSEVDELTARMRETGGTVSSRSDSSGRTTPYELNGTWYDLIRGNATGDDAIARHLASHAIMLSLQGIPAVYVHSLFASKNDLEGVASTRRSRVINRHRFTDLGKLEDALAEPSSRAARALAGLERQITSRRSSLAFHPAAAQRVLETQSGVLGIERTHWHGTTARVYVNVTGESVIVSNTGGSAVQGHRVEAKGDRIRLGPWGNAWIT